MIKHIVLPLLAASTISISLSAQTTIGKSPSGGDIVLVNPGDGRGDVIISYPGNDSNDPTLINCKNYPKLCKDLDQRKEPDESEPNDPGKDKKKRKKKKKQSYSYNELPRDLKILVDEFRARGFKTAWTRLSNGIWVEVKDIETFIAKRFSN